MEFPEFFPLQNFVIPKSHSIMVFSVMEYFPLLIEIIYMCLTKYWLLCDISISYQLTKLVLFIDCFKKNDWKIHLVGLAILSTTGANPITET